MTTDSPPASICLLRLSALGDVTHVLPLVHTLRNAWPGIRLTWVIGRGEHRLLAGLAGVEFIEDPTDYGEIMIATLKDPDGNLVQLFQTSAR